jgi:hypothetical protein
LTFYFLIAVDHASLAILVTATAAIFRSAARTGGVVLEHRRVDELEVTFGMGVA